MHRPWSRRFFAAFFSISFVSPFGAHAGPEGGEVVGGAGDISRSGTTTTIHQATDRMAIDWQSYNVGIDEGVW